MDRPDKPIIAVTMGDPSGIGPEVVAKALTVSQVRRWCRPIVIGSTWAMEKAISLTEAGLRLHTVDDIVPEGESSGLVQIIDIQNVNPEDVVLGQISARSGRASMEWVAKAAELAMAGRIHGMVTAPVNKEAVSLAGYREIGHMEFLQQITGSVDVATMLVSGNLKVVHLTTHLSLRDACDYVTKERILSKLVLIDRAFNEWRMPNPSIAVAALNPHTSDGGLLGKEEADEIGPAVVEARKLGIDVQGPVSADIVFHQAIAGLYDVVLAMYHDQGHIPIKVHGFEQSVSVNLGLPFVRTSVDHGTALDIAWKGIANHTSLVEAMRVASDLCIGKGISRT